MWLCMSLIKSMTKNFLVYSCRLFRGMIGELILMSYFLCFGGLGSWA